VETDTIAPPPLGYTANQNGDSVSSANVPPPPPGYALQQNSGDAPPPPPGYKLNAAPVNFKDSIALPVPSYLNTKPQTSPSFAQTAYVDPEAPEYGGPIKSAIHPDTRKGANLVPEQDVAAVRQQRQYASEHPDEIAQAERSGYLASGLSTRERLAATAPLQARVRGSQAEEMNAVNDRQLQWAGDKGADVGEALIRARFPDGQQPSPAQVGVSRSVGKNVAQTVANPLTYAMGPLGSTGKVAQVGMSALFAAQAAKGTYDMAGQLGTIWDNPDVAPERKFELGTDAVLNGIMAGLTGAHAIKVPLMTGAEPFLSSIPPEYREAFAQKFNSVVKQGGGVLSRASSTVGDVMAEVGNADRENLPSAAVTTLRKSVPKVPVNTAEMALPLIRAVADQSGFKNVTVADALDSQPDNNGTVHPGLIGQAKSEVIAQADKAAGPGRTIADLSPKEAQPFISQLDALDELHDHIEAAQQAETDALKQAANKGKIPESAAQAIGKMATGAGKYALARSVGAAIPFGGPLMRAGLNAAGIGSGFGDLVSGVKYFIGRGGKLSPTLDDTLDSAISKAQPAFTESAIGGDDTPQAATPYSGDTSVQHETSIAPPDQPHGDAPLFPVNNRTTGPRIPLWQQAGVTAGRPAVIEPEPMTPRPLHQPAPEVRQRSIMQTIANSPQPDMGGMGDVETGVPSTSTQGMSMPVSHNPGDYAVPRGGHPEEIVTRWLQQSKKQDVFNVAKQLGIEVSAADTHQTLIPQILDRLDEEGVMEHMAEFAQGQRGEVQPSSERMPSRDTDLTPQLQASLEQANARRPSGAGAERRQNLDLRAQYDQMPEDQRVQALFYSEKTGLPNDRAFVFASKPAELGISHPNVGFSDIDDFKTYNTAFGEPAVNEKVLPMVGEAFKTASAPENGAVHVFHMHGDEFTLRGTDPAAIDRVMGRLNDSLKDAVFTIKKPDGSTVQMKGMGFSHGIGEDLDIANAAEKLSKQARKEAGLRTGSRDSAVLPLGGQNPTGQQAPINNTASQQAVLAPIARANETGPRAVLFPQERAAASPSIANPVTAGQRGITFQAEQPTPPMPPIARPGTIPSVELPLAPAQITRPESRPSIAAAAPANAPRVVRAAALQPGDAALVPTSDLKADPSRFQYKSGTNEEGVTNALKDQGRYDPNKGGVLLVWKDPADGNTYIVNGHHRFELATRTGAPNVLARMIDAPNAAEAKTVGAETNIAEGHGSTVDAARFFKSAGIDTPDKAAARDLPLGQSKVTDGLAMARLDDSIIDRVESGDIPEGRAVAIGRITANPAQQDATIQAIAKAEARTGKTVNHGEAESIARQVRDADTHVEQGQDLFGAFNREQSLFGEQASIDDYVLKQLRTDKRTFGAVASKTKAETLGKVKGQQINPEENQRISEQAAQAEQLYNKLVNHPGALNEIRKNAAKELANRYSRPQDVKQKAYEAIRSELQNQIGAMSDQAEEARQ
jgi:GGDEF domain-containing protein